MCTYCQYMWNTYTGLDTYQVLIVISEGIYWCFLQEFTCVCVQFIYSEIQVSWTLRDIDVHTTLFSPQKGKAFKQIWHSRKWRIETFVEFWSIDSLEITFCAETVLSMVLSKLWRLLEKSPNYIPLDYEFNVRVLKNFITYTS